MFFAIHGGGACSLAASRMSRDGLVTITRRPVGTVCRRPDEKQISDQPSACAGGLPRRNVAADGSVAAAGGCGGRLRVDAARTRRLCRCRCAVGS